MLGKPLIAWTVTQAAKSNYLDRVIVSTDDDEIAAIARAHGADIPFIRPAELARDDSPVADAVVHALTTLKNAGDSYGFVALLEPTSPMRRRGDIDCGLKLLLEHRTAASLVTAGEVHTEHPLIVKRIVDKWIVPYIASNTLVYQRQQADKVYFPYGVLYCAKVSSYLTGRTFYTERTIPMLIDRWQNYEIDDELDWMVVETIMRTKIAEIDGGS